MKKFILLSISITLLFSACKKGANDPTISLLTRKARVVGEWTIKSGTFTYSTTSSQNKKTNERFTYSENSYDYVGTDENNVTYTAKGTYVFKMKFEKDGKVKITETLDNMSSVINGTWNFNSGVGSAKSKEEIIIHATYESYPVGSTKYSGNQTNITYTLTQLRNKKMSLYLTYKEENSDNSITSVAKSYEMKQ